MSHLDWHRGLVERSNRTLREALEETQFASRQEAEKELARIITWYNDRRLHSALGYLRPADYYRGKPEELHAARRTKLAQCVTAGEKPTSSYANQPCPWKTITAPLKPPAFCATADETFQECKQAIFQILHAPPSAFGFNRTTWRRKDIHSVLMTQGRAIGQNNIDKIIKNAGYRFLKARRVLTSNDPNYRVKVDRIKTILRNLRRSQRFFSIDEFGPFAVKQQGGRRLVGPGEYPTVPQIQRSKGSLIIAAALELSRNQVTHFYSSGKNTSEMIKLVDILLEQYRDCTKLYLSWDAGSWHASRRFNEKLAAVNKRTFRRENRTPAVDVAPLPTRAQFLNVIESVFSGLAVSIVHNSDYKSVDDAKAAIDRYFYDRNRHFQKNSKRAGNKIWGGERVVGVFEESNNCKNARFR